jgi:hypothetical protein
MDVYGCQYLAGVKDEGAARIIALNEVPASIAQFLNQKGTSTSKKKKEKLIEALLEVACMFNMKSNMIGFLRHCDDSL